MSSAIRISSINSDSSRSCDSACEKNTVYPPGIYTNPPACMIPVEDYKRYFDENYDGRYNAPNQASEVQLPGWQNPYVASNSAAAAASANTISAQTLSVVINPVTSLKTISGNPYGITFQMRRRNKTITAQWEGFSCLIGANGLRYVTINNTIQNAPQHNVSFPIYLQYNGVGKIGLFKIIPNSPEMYRIYFDHNNSIVSNVRDTLEVEGASITWISLY